MWAPLLCNVVVVTCSLTHDSFDLSQQVSFDSCMPQYLCANLHFLQMVLEVLQTVTEEQRALDEQIARLRATSRSNEDRLRGCEELVLSSCLCS